MQSPFPECNIRPFLLAFHRNKYKFFREQLPMPQKRVVDIPGKRITDWHNWVIRRSSTNRSESWCKDVRVPENWFGQGDPDYVDSFLRKY